MAKNINIKFPFKETQDNGVFASNSVTESAVQSDLISLLTTKRGQRVMNNNLYSPIFDYIDEPLDDILTKRLDTDIRNKVSEFIPQIEIRNIVFTPNPDENLLGIMIVFTIKNLFNVTQKVTLNIPTSQINQQ